MDKQLQISNIAFLKGFVDLVQLTISTLKGPFLMGVEVSQTDIIDDHILDQRVTIDADLDINLFRFSVLLFLVLFRRHEVLLDQIQSVQFVVQQQVVYVLDPKQGTVLRSFFLSKIDCSDLLVEPNNLRLGK